MVLSDSRWQDCTYTDRSTGEYVVFYQGGPIYHCTHVPCPVYQSSANSEYNAACTTVMDLEHLRIPSIELLNMDPYVVP